MIDETRDSDDHTMDSSLMKENRSKKQLSQELVRLRQVVSDLEKSQRNLQQAATALKQDAQKCRVIADNTYDWEFWLSPDAQFIYSSPSCERVTGYLAEEFEADPTLFYKLVHAEDLCYVAENMNRRKFEAGLSEIEFRIICRDGSQKWIALAFLPVYEGTDFIGTRGSSRDITERKRVEVEREGLISDLRDALSKVKLLSGLIPICAHCKKIRDDKGYWNQIESYIKDHSEASFTHGICPDCLEKEVNSYWKNKK